MNAMKRIVILGVGTLACFAGCNFTPDYNRPKAPVPPDWPAGAAYSVSQPASAPTDIARLTRKDFFSDGKLLRVVEIALENNRDLRLAALNAERAHAMYDLQRAELLPVLNAGGNFSRQRVAADLSGSGQPMTYSQYGTNFGMASWEIDFFGRIRSLADRALDEYLATEQARRSTQILIVAETAGAYMTLAADLETLKLAQTTLDTQLAANDLVKRRVDRGLVPELDLFRTQTQVDSARVDLARYTQLVAQDENALNLLVGAVVPRELLPTELGSISPLKEISPGVSSEALLARPDIAQAEAMLRAANANIGAARAAFFPRISLTASIGTASNELSSLFNSSSRAWMFSPQAVMPIFDTRVWAALAVTKVDQKAAVTQYEKAIQEAFREVADTLAVRGTVDQQISAQESLVHASAETYRLSGARYIKGVDNYLSVLDAQQSLYAAQQKLVTLRLAKLANQVKLYAVLGGGWQSEPAGNK